MEYGLSLSWCVVQCWFALLNGLLKCAQKFLLATCSLNLLIWHSLYIFFLTLQSGVGPEPFKGWVWRALASSPSISRAFLEPFGKKEQIPFLTSYAVHSFQKEPQGQIKTKDKSWWKHIGKSSAHWYFLCCILAAFQFPSFLEKVREGSFKTA